jgi:hypothetical protein
MANVNNVINQEIKNSDDLRLWTVKLAESLQTIANDLEMVEGELGGKLRQIPVVEGNARTKSRAVVYQVTKTRLMIWAARKAVVATWKSYQRHFGAELAAKNGTKKKPEFTV